MIHWIAGSPELSAAVAASKQATCIFYENDYPSYTVNEKTQKVIVTGHRTFEAAVLLSHKNPGNKIAVLNFANAFCPGGGVTQGSGAQEESLCRCSTLYPLLFRKSLDDSFYKIHREMKTAKASDSLIYSEGVVICKTDDEYPKRLPADERVKVDVMTMAAPDLRSSANQYVDLIGEVAHMRDTELFAYHVKRAIHMLTVAASKQVDDLVLGAFGCGAFHNDPEVMAKAYLTALQQFPRVFSTVEFAVYCSPDKDENYQIFHRVLSPLF